MTRLFVTATIVLAVPRVKPGDDPAINGPAQTIDVSDAWDDMR
jgi:hypothetical protein